MNLTKDETDFLISCNIHPHYEDGKLIAAKIITENDEGAHLYSSDILKLSQILYKYVSHPPVQDGIVGWVSVDNKPEKEGWYVTESEYIGKHTYPNDRSDTYFRNGKWDSITEEWKIIRWLDETTVSKPLPPSYANQQEQWISVKDRLPEVGKIDSGTLVLTYPHYINCSYGQFINARTGNEETGFYSFDGEYDGDIKIHGVTHFRKRLPLPEPPKQ